MQQYSHRSQTRFGDRRARGRIGHTVAGAAPGRWKVRKIGSGFVPVIMRRSVAFALVSTFFFGGINQIAADVNPTSVAYLQASPQNAWITMALSAAQVQHPAIDHLRTVSGSTVNDYAKAILALTAAGENPQTFGNIDYVAALENLAVSGQLGDANYLNDDAWGILALSAAGIATSTTAITEPLTFLRGNQNADGGFSFAVGGSSDTNSTAAVMLALIEGGVGPATTAIQQALAYLKAAQNADGGFPYAPGDESDADSTAWAVLAIRKAGQDPAAWTKSSGNPVTFFASLANPDGSFSWKRSVPGANLFATQDAVLALSGTTIPVGYFRTPGFEGLGFRFRLEGRDHSLCDQKFDGVTAYDLLVAGSTACGYTFSGQTYEGLGFILGQVNDEPAVGFAAWMYLVNDAPSSIGLQGYQLQPNDEVVVYYDPDYRTPAYPDYDRPLRLAVYPTRVSSGQAIVATVTGLRDGGWEPAANTTIHGGTSDEVTGADGAATLYLANGTFQLFATHADMVRSAGNSVVVGDGVSSRVGLQAEVVGGNGSNMPGGGTVAGSSIAFTVSPEQLSFGRLQPGSQSEVHLQLQNSGTSGITVTAQVNGDLLFSGLALDNARWQEYQQALASQATASTTVMLAVPSDYLGRGIKTGELIFWAEAK